MFFCSYVLFKGFEFTDRFARGRKTLSNNHKFDKSCQKEGTEHHLTAPATPKSKVKLISILCMFISYKRSHCERFV